ncbi:MAG: hypothetical protein GY913_07850 [Proteobacteria bacterium]|nr:hypothetical protein [Pseudomonadota bacterium]
MRRMLALPIGAALFWSADARAQDFDPDAAGDLVITEFMPEPQKVADYYGEWFEITNASDKLKDLNGLVVQDDAGTEIIAITEPSPGALRILPGESLVFGVSDEQDDEESGYNGNIPVDYVYDFQDFQLDRSADSIVLVWGTDTIDELIWTSAWGVSQTAAFQVGPQATLEWANDLNVNWCDADRYIDGVGLFGTPGDTNDYCNDAGQDDDGDGYSEQQGDCDDSDPYVNPGTVDGAGDPFGNADDDADCDNVRDDGLTDDDGDGYSEVDGDCDDTDQNINPSKSEGKNPDGIDNDCNCWIDDVDGDGDGYPNFDDSEYDPYSDPVVESMFCDPEEVGDCLDDGEIDGVTAVEINPGATEVPYNGVDEDCDGVDLCDVDMDGYDSELCDGGNDCNDDNELIHPGAADENGAADGIDNDCDGIIDSPDRDGDGWMVSDGDCDDQNAEVNPAVEELCDDFLDNNCDGFYNENCDYPALTASAQGGSILGCSALGVAGTGGLAALSLLSLLFRRRE